jgi:hypothetical protein
LRTLGIWAAVVVVGAVAYAELVSDWRIRRSDQHARLAISVTHSMSVVDYNKRAAEMKQKYGQRAKATLAIDTGRVEVTLDGRVMETYEEKRTLESAYGLFVIGSKDAAAARFPFRLSASQNIERLDRSLADWFRRHFTDYPPAWFEFRDDDWTIDRCAPLPAGLGLGKFGEWLRLREGTSCVVTWKRATPVSMLIIVSRADGDPWMRPFARRLCRAITDAALKRFEAGQPNSPQYAACVLADRPEYASARKSLALGVYSVGAGNRLALMASLPR